MSKVEQAYEAYKKGSKTKIINGETYFKIIYKESFNITGRGKVISAVLPAALFEKGRHTNRFSDENGIMIESGMPAHYSFRSGIPEWYMNSFSVFIFGFENENEIGDYLIPIENKRE